jgi:hypothetical protein
VLKNNDFGGAFMNLLIKLLVFSFPFVLAGALLWPVFVEKSLPAKAVTEEDPLLKSSSIIENYKPDLNTQKSAAKAPGYQQASEQQVESNIYRWVDENGRVHFSDRPLHQDAVAHDPEPFGNISVSGAVKQRLARQQLQNERLKAQLLAESARKALQQPKTSTAQENYEFSNVSAGQKHGYVLLTGRVSGGPECQNLLVKATARSDEGGRARGRDTVKLAGFGSTLYEMKIDSSWQGGKQRRPQWDTVKVTAFCQE